MAKRLGESSSRISALVGCSRSTVISIYQKWCKEGEAASRRQGHGRPRLIDALGERRLARMVETDRAATVAQIAEKVNAVSDRKISEYTVHRSLLRMGLRRKKVSSASLLANVQVSASMGTDAHRQRRLDWALEYQNWTMEQWKSVAWSSASRFVLHKVDGSVSMRRLPSKEDISGADKATGDIDITLWAVFCWETLGPFVQILDTLTHATYLDILADHVHPFITTVFPEGSGHFQQDNVHCHTSDSVQDWFEEHDHEFTVLTWPPDSPDLSPMEKLWDILDREIQSMRTSPHSLEELKELLLTSWCHIPQDIFRGLVESMPFRVKAVLETQGGPEEQGRGDHVKADGLILPH